jgi:hypothetical protein
MANDSMYGLAAGVWSKDAEKADYVARRLRAGTVWINEWHLISEKAPFGGYKESGIGREFGVDGLKEYTETKHIHIDRGRRPGEETVVRCSGAEGLRMCGGGFVWNYELRITNFVFHVSCLVFIILESYIEWNAQYLQHETLNTTQGRLYLRTRPLSGTKNPLIE